LLKRILLKFAAYIILGAGIVFILACILGSIAVFIVYPDANNLKVVLVAVGLVVLAGIAGIVTFALFEVIVDDTNFNFKSQIANRKSTSFNLKSDQTK